MRELAFGNIRFETQLFLRPVVLFLLRRHVLLPPRPLVCDELSHHLADPVAYARLEASDVGCLIHGIRPAGRAHLSLPSQLICSNFFFLRRLPKLLVVIWRLESVRLHEVFLAHMHLCDLLVGNLSASWVDSRSESTFFSNGALVRGLEGLHLGRPLSDVPLQFIVVAIRFVHGSAFQRRAEALLRLLDAR